MTTYFLHVSILIAAFTIFYWLFLRQETYFQLNRWVILTSIFACIALPFFEVPSKLSVWDNPTVPTENIIESITTNPFNTQALKANELTANTTNQSAPSKAIESNSNLSWPLILKWIYIIGLIIFFLVFILQVIVMLSQRYNLNSFESGNYRIVEMVKDREPCSFMNYIFINPGKYDSETYNHIIEHEKAHIDQSHFIDKVIAELLVVIFWFNPFTWLLRKSISQNLEFLTDQSLLLQGIQKDKYQMSLLKVSVSNRPLNLTASYNSSFLKNRIKMMNAKNSSIVAAWKYLFIVPLFVLSIATLNAVQGNQYMQKTKTEQSNSYSKVDPTTGYITKQIELPHINKIALQTGGNVILSYGSKQEIVMKGPAELVNEINTDIHDGNWQIRYKTPAARPNSKQLTVYATITDLSHLALSGKGNIKTTNKFMDLGDVMIALSGTGDIGFNGDSKSIHSALSGTGNIDIESHTGWVKVALSGTGNMSFEGSAIESQYTLAGSGNVSADKMPTGKSQITINGSSTIAVRVSELLDVTSAGSAVVQYYGSPQIKKDVIEESRLVKLD